MMKKITFTTVVILLLAASCKKNRVCNCDYTNGDQESSILVNKKKKDAKNICRAKSNSVRDCDLQ